MNPGKFGGNARENDMFKHKNEYIYEYIYI